MMVGPEKAMQAADGELSPTSLLDYGPCMLKYQHATQDLLVCTLVGSAVLGRTNSLLTGFKDSSTRRGSSCVLL